MTQLPLWLAILLPLLGYAAAAGTEFLRNHLQARREAHQRVAHRKEAIQDRRKEFELLVLKDTYAALARFTRAAMRYHLADREVAKKLGVRYASHQIGVVTGAELEEEFRISSGELTRHHELLLDDELRFLVASAQDALLVPSSMYNSEIEEAQLAMNQAVVEVEHVQKQLSIRIRAMYT